MCGIVGHIKAKGTIDPLVFEPMIDLLAHRGPDGRGSHYNAEGNIAFGHRRLSFLDLGENGKQPFLNQDGNIWVSFNGEIYNYLELKEELRSRFEFRTQTDTEVLLAAYQVWGIEFINKIKGMFAFALYDEKKKSLYLARDRFGIKPLYYGLPASNELVFASELKSIRASKAFPKELNYSAISDYFVYRYIPSPKSIWKGIHKVPPAHYLKLDLSDFSYKLHEYWKLEASKNEISEAEMVTETNRLIDQSVREHLRSDVSIGSFLSGGYDSSALVAKMTQNFLSPNAFTIGFESWGASEHQYAKIVADHLKIPLDETIVDQSSLKEIDKMPIMYDEPIADISIIPTHLVSKLASYKNKAVFSGEGADELFGGYTWQHEYFEKRYSKNWLQKIKKLISSENDLDFYSRSMAMGWFDQSELEQLLQPNLHASIPDDVHWFYKKHLNKGLSPMKRIQQLDIKCFMGELVLTKIDRASMYHSLEVRVPFLDHHLFEKIFSYPEETYIDPNQTKKLLYESIKKSLPASILKRKKQGFVGPDQYYMNISFYKQQLRNSKLVAFGIVNQSYIDQLLKRNYDWRLWKILVLEKWVGHWMSDKQD